MTWLCTFCKKNFKFQHFFQCLSFFSCECVCVCVGGCVWVLCVCVWVVCACIFEYLKKKNFFCCSIYKCFCQVFRQELHIFLSVLLFEKLSFFQSLLSLLFSVTWQTSLCLSTSFYVSYFVFDRNCGCFFCLFFIYLFVLSSLLCWRIFWRKKSLFADVKSWRFSLFNASSYLINI